MFHAYFEKEVSHQRDLKNVEKEDCREHEVYEAATAIAEEFPPYEDIKANSKVADTFQTGKSNLHNKI